MASIDCYASAGCDLDLWPLWTQIHLCQKLVSIHWFFGSLPGSSAHCLLWPWLLTSWPRNLTSTLVNPYTTMTKIGWNSLHWSLKYGVGKVYRVIACWFLRYGVHKVFSSLSAVTLTFRPQNLISTSTNPNTSVIGWNSLHEFLRYGIHKVFGMQTNVLTHGRTDPNTVCLRHCFSMAAET